MKTRNKPASRKRHPLDLTAASLTVGRGSLSRVERLARIIEENLPIRDIGL
jgi:hypothetical protein